MSRCSHRNTDHATDFFFNDTAPTEIYTLSLHDALPISRTRDRPHLARPPALARHRRADPGHDRGAMGAAPGHPDRPDRSEEHTSELQSRRDLVCRLLLEKKKTSSHSC